MKKSTPPSPGLEAISKAYGCEPKTRCERAGVVYWYALKPVDGKQEVRKPVRFFSVAEKVELLAESGAYIAREIELVLRRDAAPRRNRTASGHRRVSSG